MANTIINFKRGNSDNLLSNSINTNEPIWTNDDDYKRLFISEGSNIATIVNPVVRYNSRFPNELEDVFQNLYGHGDNEFIEFPNIFSKEARNENIGLINIDLSHLHYAEIDSTNPATDYEAQGSIGLDFNFDNESYVTFDRIEAKIDGNDDYTSWPGDDVDVNSFYIDQSTNKAYIQFNGTLDNDLCFQSQCQIKLYYTQQSQPKDLSFTIFVTKNTTFTYEIGENPTINRIANNIAQSDIGKDCMEVGYNYAFLNRMRELSHQYYYPIKGLMPGAMYCIQNGGDHWTLYENNVAIGGFCGNRGSDDELRTSGTITLYAIGEGGDFASKTTLIPQSPLGDSGNINVALPRTSGSLPTINIYNTRYQGPNDISPIVGGTYQYDIHSHNMRNELGSTSVAVGRADTDTVDFVPVRVDNTPFSIDASQQTGHTDLFFMSHIDYTKESSSSFDTAKTSFEWKNFGDLFDIEDNSVTSTTHFNFNESGQISINTQVFPTHSMNSIELGVGLDNNSPTITKYITQDYSNVRLKTASTNEIGGIKIQSLTHFPQYTKLASGVNLPLKIDDNGLGFVTASPNDAYKNIEQAKTALYFDGAYGTQYRSISLHAKSAKWEKGLTHYIYDYTDDNSNHVSLGVGDFFKENPDQVLTLYITGLNKFFDNINEKIEKLHFFFFGSKTNDITLDYANADLPIYLHFNTITFGNNTPWGKITTDTVVCDTAVAELYTIDLEDSQVIECFWRFYSQSDASEAEYWQNAQI